MEEAVGTLVFSKRYQAVSHLEQSQGSTGCFHWLMTHSHQVEVGGDREGVHPWEAQAALHVGREEETVYMGLNFLWVAQDHGTYLHSDETIGEDGK